MVGGTTFCANCDTELEVPAPVNLIERRQGPDAEESAELEQELPAAEPLPSVPPADAMAQEKAVHFRSKRSGAEEGLDLTPMVDVTFLLLIFFMVTASFQIQKSLEVPAPQSDAPSSQSQQDSPEEDPDTILVRVDSLNTFFVSCAAWEREREAANDQVLYREVRAARASNSSNPPSTLLVIAHVNALHENVVAAIDAGADAGVNQIRVQSTTEEE